MSSPCQNGGEEHDILVPIRDGNGVVVGAECQYCNEIMEAQVPEDNKDKVQSFFAFVETRHRIWHKRFVLKEPSPWTQDPILRKYKFTNVFRELDRTTIYYLEEIMPRCRDKPTLLFNTIVFRVFNRISTAKIVGVHEPLVFNTQYIHNILKEKLDDGEQVFTNAFMVTGRYRPKGSDKIENYLHCIELLRMKILRGVYAEHYNKSIKGLWSVLKEEDGLGDFLAYEIVSDLAYSSLFPNIDADEWANPGPGAKRGLRRIWPNLLESEMQDRMRWLRDNQREYHNIDKRLNLRNIEHCLCEFDKYERARLGEGRPRLLFRPNEEEINYEDTKMV